MKKSLCVLFTLTLFLSSCDDEKSFKLDGSYCGIFYRTRDGVKVLNSDVSFTFEGDRFSGTSSSINSPAICSGTFSTTENEIDFVNECAFTANFDGTLILNEKFTVSEDLEDLILAKEIDAHNGDYYILRKGNDPL